MARAFLTMMVLALLLGYPYSAGWAFCAAVISAGIWLLSGPRSRWPWL